MQFPITFVAIVRVRATWIKSFGSMALDATDYMTGSNLAVSSGWNVR